MDTAQQASEFVRQRGLEPLEGFPGWSKVWLCRCTVCGSEVRPKLGEVRAGRASPCRACARRAMAERMRGDPDEATALMLSRGYRPLEPYPGSRPKWRCVHVPCGGEVMATYGKVRAGEGCCGPCGITASADGRRASAEASALVMMDALLEPLVSYPGGNHRPWKCRCLRCGAVVSPTRANITRGQGGCVPCGKKRAALSRRGDAGAAASEMLDALFEPLEDYPGSNNPWRCRCLRCNDVVGPRLTHIRAGRVGCLTCGFASNRAKQLGDPVQAVADMRAEGYEPLEDYPGAGKPWRSRHEPCQREVTARLQTIRAGGGCCGHCATYGFNLTAPAHVYVLHHPEMQAVKVGITAAGSDRIVRFTRKGWNIIGIRPTGTGSQARAIEQPVLRHLRRERGLRPYLSAEQTQGTGGSTETFDAVELPPSDLWALVIAAVPPGTASPSAGSVS